jgi:hypothetical protein
MTAQNLTPTTEQKRATLARFADPAERSSDPVECHLYNEGMIRPVKRTTRAANYKHGRYARREWVITEQGRAVLNPCKALVPYTAPCRALMVSPLPFYIVRMRSVWEAHAPAEFAPVRLSEPCPF